MTDDGLSIARAAREQPARVAVETEERTWSFAACAAQVGEAAARVIVATPGIGTVMAVMAAFEERRPIALLHHRLTADELARQRAMAERAALDVDAAVVLFTSGSTGASKGIVLSRAALLAAAAASAAHLGWRDDDRWLLALSMAHAGGLSILVRCLIGRRTIVLADDPERLADMLERCTLASLVPTQLAQLLEDPAWRPPAKLRAVLLGGAASPPALLARAAERGVPFLLTYGMTETLGQLATAPLERAGDPAAPLVPLAGVTLIGGTAAAPAPITVRAPMLATRYLEGTAIAPVFETADLGHVTNGALHVVGRRDDVIITGGENVHPTAVEAVLAATPGVRGVCVFGVADERWGQIIGAAIATDDDFDIAHAAARWHAALPPHQRPRRVASCVALPLLPSGKIDRHAAARLPTTPIAYPR